MKQKSQKQKIDGTRDEEKLLGFGNACFFDSNASFTPR